MLEIAGHVQALDTSGPDNAGAFAPEPSEFGLSPRALKRRWMI